DAQDSTLWTGTLPVTGPVHFMVQAVNGVGLVTLDDNVGAFYTAGAIQPALATATQVTPTTLQLSAPAGGAGGTQATVTATLTGPSAPEQVTFTLGSQTRTVPTSGGVASATIPLVDAPGSYSITASFDGDSSFGASSASASFAISKLGASLTLAP